MKTRGGFDFILVGGGLQNGLIALALLAGSRARVALVEAQAKPGGNHTWCFHARDALAEDAAIVEPLVVRRWDAYEVRFPGFRRILHSAYAAIPSERLSEALARAFARREDCTLACGARATSVESHRVVLENGHVLEGMTVIDARGPLVSSRGCGYQKFFGLELLTSRPHGLDRPLVMDATVAQRDGYRFFYVLPLDPSRLLVEETWFSRSPRLDRKASRRSIASYVDERGWHAEEAIRSESGVLPMPWRGAFARPSASPLVAGYAGGWFHPATGYSFPIALRLARHVARRAPDALFDRALQRMFDSHVSQIRYMHALNRLLFRALAPDRMWHVFERFYRLPEDAIERFYSLELSTRDRVRILLGRPPRGFSVWRMLANEVAA